MKPRFHMHPGVGWAATTPLYYTLQHLHQYCITGHTKEPHYWALACRENTSDYDRYRNQVLTKCDDVSCNGKKQLIPDIVPELKKNIFTDSFLSEWYSPPFTVDKYLSYFLLLNEHKGDYSAVGDFSIFNLEIPQNLLYNLAEKMLEHFDVKITFTFSDPITRFYYEIGRLCKKRVECKGRYGTLARLGKQQIIFKEKIKYGQFHSCEFGRNNCNYANSYTKYCNAFGKENVLPIIMEEFWEPEREKEQRERLSDFIGYQIKSIYPNVFWPIDNQVDDTYLTDQSGSIHEPLTPEVIEYAKKYMKHFYDDWKEVLPLPSAWNET